MLPVNKVRKIALHITGTKNTQPLLAAQRQQQCNGANLIHLSSLHHHVSICVCISTSLPISQTHLVHSCCSTHTFDSCPMCALSDKTDGLLPHDHNCYVSAVVWKLFQYSLPLLLHCNPTAGIADEHRLAVVTVAAAPVILFSLQAAIAVAGVVAAAACRTPIAG